MFHVLALMIGDINFHVLTIGKLDFKKIKKEEAEKLYQDTLKEFNAKFEK